MRPAALALAMASLAGCASPSPTQVLVLLDADGASRDGAAALHVRVWTQEGVLVLDQREPLVGAAARAELPVRVPVSPRDGDVGRVFVLEGVLLDDAGSPLGWVRVRSGFVEGEIRELRECFHDACRGEPCGAVDGACLADGACETCGSDALCGTATRDPVPLGTAPAACVGVDCTPTADREAACGDGLDEDCDGAADCLDGDCADLPCGVAGRVCAGGACVCPGGDRELACADGLDEDCDALVDCADPDCEGLACGEGGACAAGACACGTGDFEDTLALCHDGIDNDCDGRVDCDQGACQAFTETAPSDCADGIDNDCDGAADCADSDCEIVAEICDNGVDDDCDGAVDCADSECCPLAACEGQRCGAGVGELCCPGAGCTDTHADADNCGGCGIRCSGARTCRRVPGTSEGACRCSLTDNDCPRNFDCRFLQDTTLCDCLANEATSCPGGYTCRRNGGPMFHNTCEWTG